VTAIVYYDDVNEIALLSFTFLNPAGTAADPTTVSCIITEPAGVKTTHTYGSTPPNNDIVKVMTGKYTLSVACSPTMAGIDGLWGFEWIGTGVVQDAQPGTWRVLPAAVSQLWYCGMEELKGRLGIELTDTSQDYELQTAIAAASGWINEYCVVMETPILTADLRWVPAGDLVLGQEIIGVDEEPSVLRPMANGAAKWLRGTNHGRHYRRAEVRAVPLRKTECIRLILDDGREVICATDHRWLARHCWPSGKPRAGYHWAHVRDLDPGDEISSPLRVWPEETSFEAGWVSGLFDGEGWFGRSKPTHTRIGVAQNPGPVLDGIFKYLDNLGIPHYETGTPAHDACVRVEIGARWAVMELMGRLRPRRMFPLANEIWEDRSMVGAGRSNVRILAAEPAGVRDVVSLGTSTGTYLANGLISHNCGRHFNRIVEARTYQPTNVWMLDIDDLVDDPSIQVSVDQTGTGTYDQAWVRGTDYVLRYGTGQFNPNVTGQPRPFRQLQVVQSGKWLPFTWPYSNLNRVRIQGPWGWPSIPWQVSEASRILSADEFKLKDAPFGVAGVSDIGVVRVQSNPWIVENLRAFVNGRRKVGV
jgi:hypothetical protein